MTASYITFTAMAQDIPSASTAKSSDRTDGSAENCSPSSSSNPFAAASFMGPARGRQHSRQRGPAGDSVPINKETEALSNRVLLHADLRQGAGRLFSLTVD